MGCNWAFAPVVDIDRNWRNPITNVRTYGDDPDRVLACGVNYIKAAKKKMYLLQLNIFREMAAMRWISIFLPV